MSRSKGIIQKRYSELRRKNKKYNGVGLKNGVANIPHIDTTKFIYK